MKKIIYGQSGYGKSYNYIAPIIRENNNLILITSNNLESELNYMGLPHNILDIGEINELTKDFGKIAISLWDVAEINKTKAFIETLNMLENNGYTLNENITIIMIGFSPDLFNDRIFVRKLEKWQANVIVEYICTEDEIECRGELDYIMNISLKWEKIPVFVKYSV